MSRVLGIDCGSIATGYGIIDCEGRSARMVASGVILTGTRLSFPQRLKQISDALRKLIKSHSPEVAAVEEIFYSVNVKSLVKLGQVKGVVLLAAADAGLLIHEYSPLEIKSAVVGYGRAEKSQVQQMVKLFFGLKRLPPEDAADALAVALCHAHRAQTLRKISQSAAGRGATALPPIQPLA
jgi:crossover junction endodeoxyribonuclease RuvC